MRKNHTNPDCSQNYGGHMTDRCDCDAGHDEMSEMITELRAENAELKAVVGRLFPMVEEAWWDRYSAGVLPGAGYTGRAIQMLSSQWDWRDKAGFQAFEKRVAALLGKAGEVSRDE